MPWEWYSDRGRAFGERQWRSAPAKRCQREGSMEGPQILRPLPFCSKELPFFPSVQITRVAESSWCALMY